MGAIWDRAVRGAWVEFLGRVPWDLFVTLTYDPKRYRRSGPESWLSSVRWFMSEWFGQAAVDAGRGYWEVKVDDAGREVKRLRGSVGNAWRAGRQQPMWALAIEPHEDGRLHAHLLLKFPDWCPRLDWVTGQDLWYRNRGLCKFEVPRSRNDVCGYVAEYVLKGQGEGLTLSPNFDAAAMATAQSVPQSAQADTPV